NTLSLHDALPVAGRPRLSRSHPVAREAAARSRRTGGLTPGHERHPGAAIRVTRHVAMEDRDAKNPWSVARQSRVVRSAGLCARLKRAGEGESGPGHANIDQA